MSYRTLLIYGICAWLCVPLWGMSFPAPVIVPEEMWYCGMKLRFTPEGRQSIQEKVDFLVQNPRAHQVLTHKAEIFMPFIEDAFRHIGVPDDLKYIAIQESGLRGDAVSSSMAVGFWQMKDFTAREVGLQITSLIDERKHIFRSSVGAARYFRKNFSRFDNWVYSIIAYYAGATGALPFVESEYFGEEVMTVDADLHWYAQKAIAHKLAFEDAIGTGNKSSLWLLPKDANGEVSIRKLAEMNMVDYDELLAYNLWIEGDRLPGDRPMSYYVPQKNKPYVYISDPHRRLFAPERNLVARSTSPTFASVSDKTRVVQDNQPGQSPNDIANISQEDHRAFSQWFSHRREQEASPEPERDARVMEYPVTKEPLYGEEIVEVTPRYSLADIARRYDVKERRIRRWNNLKPKEDPPPGTLLLLVKPRRASIHIAGKMETIADVADRYKKNYKRLMEYNYIDSLGQMLTEGEKIYLREQRPRERYRIVYYKVTPGRLKKFGLRAQAEAREERDADEQATANRLEATADSGFFSEEELQAPESGTSRVKPQADGASTSPGSDVEAASPSNPAAEENPDDTEALDGNEHPTVDEAVKAQVVSRLLGPSAHADTSSTPVQEVATEPQTSLEAQQAPALATTATQKEDPAYRWHTIRTGDTLWNIARRYGMTVAELREMNNQRMDRIHIGDRIRVRVQP